MIDPIVCCVCITRGRPELLAQAVECFRRQTYVHKRLVIYDSTPEMERPNMLDYPPDTVYGFGGQADGESIASLRNFATSRAVESFSPEILITWDDDDWSHPERTAEQVEFLQLTGADVVGYNEMLFWDVRGEDPRVVAGSGVSGSYYESAPIYGQAWRYTGSILGTSMCYRRQTWERYGFQDDGWHNEDTGFALKVIQGGGKVRAVSSITATATGPAASGGDVAGAVHEPRMIARIHAGNVGNPSYQTLDTHQQHWTRAPDWDEYCRSSLTSATGTTAQLQASRPVGK